MVDFAERVSDDSARRRLGRAIQGRGAFRRFKDELYEEYPDLVPAWRAVRAEGRAVEWLLDQGLSGDGRKPLPDRPPGDRPSLKRRPRDDDGTKSSVTPDAHTDASGGRAGRTSGRSTGGLALGCFDPGPEVDSERCATGADHRLAESGS